MAAAELLGQPGPTARQAPRALYCIWPGAPGLSCPSPRYDHDPVEPPAKILLIRPSALGDVCRTVPVLASLRRAWPDAAIDWLVQDDFADAVRAHPMLNAAVPFPRRELGNALRRGRPAALREWIGHLRHNAYDLVIDAQGLFRSGFLARASGARGRVGHRNARECAWLCYTVRERGSEGRHTVDRMLALVETIGVEPVRDMRLYSPAEDREAAAGDPRLRGRYVVFAPTSRWPGKQWPADRFDDLARSLLDRGAADRLVVVGGPGEREQCEPLLARAERDDRVLDMVGRTSIGGLMATISRSALVVANDSAALHMAVGFDRPLVALFGPTRIDLVGPYRRDADALQIIEPGDRFDHKDAGPGGAMMARISTESVLEACLARLREEPIGQVTE